MVEYTLLDDYLHQQLWPCCSGQAAWTRVEIMGKCKRRERAAKPRERCMCCVALSMQWAGCLLPTSVGVQYMVLHLPWGPAETGSQLVQLGPPASQGWKKIVYNTQHWNPLDQLKGERDKVGRVCGSRAGAAWLVYNPCWHCACPTFRFWFQPLHVGGKFDGRRSCLLHNVHPWPCLCHSGSHDGENKLNTVTVCVLTFKCTYLS